MKSIYLDYNSTTPVDPRVLAEMLPYFSDQFGNAGSKTHQFGWEAERAVDKARQQVSVLLHCEPSEIIFTSGATESINLALRGAMRAYHTTGKHLITVSTEHKAVLDTCNDLAESGYNITTLQVDRWGRIDLQELNLAIRNDTVLVAVMMANNETGVLQEVDAIGKICVERNVLFFSDTTQAIGKMRVDVKASGMAMACLSAHKIYGPKGVGVLYKSRRSPRVQLHPVLTGGGQEYGLRAGTLNVPGIVGMGKAAEIAADEYWDNSIQLSKLRTTLEQGLEENLGAKIIGDMRNRLPNTSSLQLPGRIAEKIISQLPHLAFSTGSACTSALPEPSHVLLAMGLSESEAQECIRISLGKQTTMEDVQTALNYFQKLKD